jgi:chromosomal replication initiation ATPase DnaA
MSFPQMGKLTGGRDHTTVLHGISKTPENIDKIIAEMVRDLSGGSSNVDTKTEKTVG